MTTSHPPTDAASPWTGEGPNERERARRMRRAGEHGVVIILGMLLIVIVAGSFPMWSAAVQGYRAVAAQRGIERHARQRGWAVGQPKAREPSRYAPRPDAYGRPGINLLEELLGPEDIGAVNVEGHGAVSRGRVEMLDRGDDDGDVVIELDPTMTMLIAKDLGRWLLVAVRKAERTQYGWVRRRDVVILP